LRLFEVIPDKFFSILASPQKEIYADVIFILYKIVSYHTSFGIDREIMTELFERIVIDDEQSQGALEKYTDYRTYMDYDIKIIHDDGNTSSFSKVCREKSGGETQTPYYVAIVGFFCASL
jgi:hypothetical protein